MDMFRVTDDGSMMLIVPDVQPDSFAHCDGFQMLEHVPIPNKIVSKSRISDIRESIIVPDNIIVILGEDVQDFGYLTRDIPVLKKVVFICMQNAAKDSLQLTGHFPHSMVLAADPDSNEIKCYRRLHFYEEMYKISKHMDECGDFSVIQTDFHAHTLHAVAFDFFPYSRPDFEKQVCHCQLPR